MAAKSDGRGRKAGASNLEIERRRQKCARLMARGLSAPEIWERHHEEWNVSLNRVHGYVRGVKRQWRAESLSDERKLDRDAIRKMCLQVIQTAYELKDTVQVGEHEYEWVHRPDLKAVNTAIKTLCQLDGLFEQGQLEGPRDINTFITVLATGYGVAPERLAGLRKALAQGNPATRAKVSIK